MHSVRKREVVDKAFNAAEAGLARGNQMLETVYGPTVASLKEQAALWSQGISKKVSALFTAGKAT